MILLFLQYFAQHMLGECGGYGWKSGQNCPICYWQKQEEKRKQRRR